MTMVMTMCRPSLIQNLCTYVHTDTTGENLGEERGRDRNKKA